MILELDELSNIKVQLCRARSSPEKRQVLKRRLRQLVLILLMRDETLRDRDLFWELSLYEPPGKNCGQNPWFERWLRDDEC